jgi:hypothetical protein
MHAPQTCRAPPMLIVLLWLRTSAALPAAGFRWLLTKPQLEQWWLPCRVSKMSSAQITTRWNVQGRFRGLVLRRQPSLQPCAMRGGAHRVANNAGLRASRVASAPPRDRITFP